MKFTLVGALVLLVLTLPVAPAAGAWGTPAMDGHRDDTYTTIATGEYNYSIANDGAWFYLHVASNQTIHAFTIAYGPLYINITTSTEIPGVVLARFASNWTLLEVRMPRALHAGTFTININTITQQMELFQPPPPPPKEEGFSLTVWMVENGPLAGALFLAFTSWVFVWTYIATKRKMLFVRKSGGPAGRYLGRWIREEEVTLGGTRYWKHTIKTDALGTARVEHWYSHLCKEELGAKGLFRQVLLVEWYLPYIRDGVMRLRPDQQFVQQVEARTPKAWAIRILYYMLCWFPRLNDHVYAARVFVDAEEEVKDKNGKPYKRKQMVIEIPFLYLTYAEEQVVELRETEWEEMAFNEQAREMQWTTKRAALTKEELILLENNENARNITKGREVFQTRKWASIDDALNDKITREELLAAHRFKMAELDAHVRRLNTRLEGEVDARLKLERQHVEDKQEFLAKIDQEKEFFSQNLANYIGRAAGYREMGMGKQDILTNVLREGHADYLASSDVNFQRKLAEIEKEKAKLREERKRLEQEREKRTRFDIHPDEVRVPEVHDRKHE